jgi:hypothetical protein
MKQKTIAERMNAEGIIRSEPATWVDNESVMQAGRLILTKAHLLFMLNGALDVAIPIDLDTINSISNGQLFTDPNILTITYLQYNTSRFSVLNYEEWEHDIEQQRMQPNV